MYSRKKGQLAVYTCNMKGALQSLFVRNGVTYTSQQWSEMCRSFLALRMDYSTSWTVVTSQSEPKRARVTIHLLDQAAARG
jgi:hypothetical protein